VLTILYCTVLYCTVLCCTVLYCTVLYPAVVHRHGGQQAPKYDGHPSAWFTARGTRAQRLLPTFTTTATSSCPPCCSTMTMPSGGRISTSKQVDSPALIVLYCTVLYCTVLYCTVLYCTVLYLLYCTVPWSTNMQLQQRAAAYHAALPLIMLWGGRTLTSKQVDSPAFIVQYGSELYCTVLYCTVLYCTVLYYTVLYCTVLYCTVLYSTVLCCTVPWSTNISTTASSRCPPCCCTMTMLWVDAPQHPSRWELHCSLLYRAELCFTVLYCTVL